MILSLTEDEKIAFFFGDEPKKYGNGVIWSTLKLIRNDIKTCRDMLRKRKRP